MQFSSVQLNKFHAEWQFCKLIHFLGFFYSQFQVTLLLASGLLLMIALREAKLIRVHKSREIMNLKLGKGLLMCELEQFKTIGNQPN